MCAVFHISILSLIPSPPPQHSRMRLKKAHIKGGCSNFLSRQEHQLRRYTKVIYTSEYFISSLHRTLWCSIEDCCTSRHDNSPHDHMINHWSCYESRRKSPGRETQVVLDNRPVTSIKHTRVSRWGVVRGDRGDRSNPQDLSAKCYNIMGICILC